MGEKNISGCTFSLNHEFNIVSSEVKFKCKAQNNWSDITNVDVKSDQSLSGMLPSFMGSIPSYSGKTAQGVSMMLAAMASICSAGKISVEPNATGSGYYASYANFLTRVMTGAYASKGKLSDDEIKKRIMLLIQQLLESAGPGFTEWKQILMDLLQKATITDFLKGVQSAICAFTGDPVNANTGNFIYDKEDIRIKGLFPLFFKRFYNRIDTRSGCMSDGWRHNYEIELLMEDDCYVILWDDGREEIYMRDDDGSIEPLFGCLCRLKRAGEYFTYLTQEGLCYTFDCKGHLISQIDANGLGLHFTYNHLGKLEVVSNGCGGTLRYQYDTASGYLLSVQDHTGRNVSLTYELGSLHQVTNAMGESYHYFYDASHSLYKIQNPKKVVVLENKYDEKGRTVKQTFADGGEIQYDYQDEECYTLVTQQDDSKVTYYHDERFRNIKTIYMDGEECFTYNERNQLTQRVDKNGNKIKFAYDDKGNKTRVIYPDGSKHNMTYDINNRLLVMSVNGTVRLKNSYDAKGNIQKSEDSLGRTREFYYDQTGTVTEIIQPDQSSMHIVHDKNGNITRVTDAGGNITSYNYDELNRIIKTVDGNGNPTSYQYDNCDRIKKVTNAKGQHRSYEYTKNGKLSSVQDFNGASLSHTYNSMNQVASITFPDGGTRHLEYDQMQNISKRIDPNGAETRYQYDLLNRLEQVTLANGGTITYGYDPNGNRTTITDANGGSTHIAYDEMNRITSVTDPANACTEYSYDMDGNIISITSPLGKSITYIYNAVGKKIGETDILGNCYSYEYNELDKVSCIIDPKQQKTRYEYSPGGTLVRVVYPTGHFESYTYDKNNNLIRRENHKGDFLEYSYDCLNRMVCTRSSLEQEQSYTYDTVGNVTSMTDTLGNVTRYTYSPGGKLLSVLDAAGNRTEYAYDSMGELITVCQHEGEKILLNSENLPGGGKAHITQYKRNLLGKVEVIIDPLGFKEEYSYDLAGQLLLKKDKEGYETHYTYASTGEMEQITYADGRSVFLSYNPLRQLTEIKDWLGITTIEIDDAGRTKKITDHKGREIAYQWNREGQQEAIIYPDGRKVSYEYDKLSRLSHLVDGDRELHYQYDEEGYLIKKNYPEGISCSYDYNQMGFLNSFKHQQDGNLLEQYVFEYDKMGNKISIRKTKKANISSVSQEMDRNLQEESGYYKYGYDSLNRLTEVSKNMIFQRRYDYDAFGNRVRQVTERTREGYHYNEANQLIRKEGIFPEESYQYDARGNLTAILHGKEVVNQYAYDETNRLSIAINDKGQAASYQYDGMGNRVGGQEYLFDRKAQHSFNMADPGSILFENPTKEIDYLLDRTNAYHNLLEKTEITEGNCSAQTYTWDGNVAFMTEGETAHIYLQDELGSTVRVVEVGGNQQTVYGYNEFGQDLYGNQGEMQPFGYTGYRKDLISNTYFAQAREYLPGIGRFNGEDIKPGKTIIPISVNRYGYCYCNPLKYIDLNGEEASETFTDYPKSDNYIPNTSISNPDKIRNNADLIEYYQKMTGNYNSLEPGQMYYIDGSASLSFPFAEVLGLGKITGQTVVFDEDKYCIYDYTGRVSGASYGVPVIDTTASMGIVNNIYEVEDFNGGFTAIFYYSLFGEGYIYAKGRSSRTGEVVDSYSEWAGSMYAMSAGTSSTVYASRTSDWIMGSYTYDTGDSIQDPCKRGLSA